MQAVDNKLETLFIFYLSVLFVNVHGIKKKNLFKGVLAFKVVLENCCMGIKCCRSATKSGNTLSPGPTLKGTCHFCNLTYLSDLLVQWASGRSKTLTSR